MSDDLLETRKEKKAKKPDFNRCEHGKKDRVNAGWRKPKGHHNKKRLNKRGHAAPVNTGWGSPVEVRGLHPTGYEPVRVHNVDDVDDLDDGQGAVIASAVGDKKRVAIIEHARDHDVPILNLDGETYVKRVEEELEERQEVEETTDDVGDVEDRDERKDPEEQMEELEDEKEEVLTRK